MDLCDIKSSQEIADLAGITVKRVQQLASELIAEGLARKVGKVLVCRADAAQWIIDRPDGRKRKAQ